MTANAQIVPLARSHVYRFLARAFADPADSRLHELREQLPLLESSLVVLGEHDGLAAARQLEKAIGALDAAALQTSHQRCFGHGISKECPPYEAEYGQAHIFQKSQCLADIAGFYRAFGLDLAEDFHDRADHICAELDYMQWLCLKEAHALSSGVTAHVSLCEDAEAGFLRDHIGRWAVSFANRLRIVAQTSFHALAAALLVAFVRAEVRALGMEPSAETPLSEVGGPRDDAAVDCTACVAAGVPLDYRER